MSDQEKHPEYGPCDALGPVGECFECRRLGLLKLPNIDVEPVAATLDGIAKQLVEMSRRVEDYAASMREKKDLSYGQEVINDITYGIANLRLSLILTRSLRALGQK